MQQPILKVNYTIDMECDWSVDYAYKGYGFAIKRPDGGTVCTLPNGLRSEEKALAYLVSAAPDMLKLLEAIWGNEKAMKHIPYDQAVEIAEVIAKARGEFDA